MVCCLLAPLLLNVRAAPRSRSKPSTHHSTTFDQKQTGEYNVQLHLKDFNVIAVVAEEGFGDFGDYDYNYDYSDFTVKPSSTTLKSSTPTASPTTQKHTTLSSSTASPTTPTRKPSVPPMTSKPESPPEVPQAPPQNHILVSISESNSRPPLAQKPSPPLFVEPSNSPPLPSSTTHQPTTTRLEEVTQTTRAPLDQKKPEATGSTIKEQEVPPTTEAHADNTRKSDVRRDDSVKQDSHATNVQVLASETQVDEQNPSIVLGEIMHYRKCSVGYARDKRGRCRRIRKPVSQLSFDITRLASGLATKLRRAENELHN